MTDEDMGRASSLEQQGKSAAAIAEILHLPANTVKSYLRRHPGTEDARICPQCRKELVSYGNQGRKLCSREWYGFPNGTEISPYYEGCFSQIGGIPCR